MCYHCPLCGNAVQYIDSAEMYYCRKHGVMTICFVEKCDTAKEETEDDD